MTIDEYILQHIDDEGDYLKALYRDTHVKLLYPRMASGHLQGRMLKMFVRMIRPRQVLEIGTYSGYSALCIAEGLPEGGMLHTFEINDEQEDFTRPWLENSDYADKIRFYIGDALELVPQLDLTFDLAFIDGDKDRFRSKYLDIPNAPLYPFGYGLSYTTFSISPIELDKPAMAKTETIQASVTIKNEGPLSGTEVIQLYIHDRAATVVRPVKELKHFRKIHLHPGESQKVTFHITDQDLRFLTEHSLPESEPGTFDLYIGTDSTTTNQTQFTLLP